MTEAVLGIDVAKKKIDVVLIISGRRRRKTFSNSRCGHLHLLQWLKDRGAATSHACMEATGGYWEALALQLHDGGHRVSVVNPSQIKNWIPPESYPAEAGAVISAGLMALERLDCLDRNLVSG